MFKVIDNAISDSDFQNLKDKIMGSNFPWYYADTVAYEEEKGDDFYFLHTFYDQCEPKSNYYNLIIPVLVKIQAKAIIRAKANAYPNINKFVKHNQHQDYKFSHKGAIFYVNSNNGYTMLENGEKIESKENRLLLFNSSKLHNSTNCTDKKMRINFNINYF
jgi:hypothetical protein